MCSLQRPLDDQTQLRILVETQAILGALALCQSGAVDLIASDAHIFEMEANPEVVRRDYVAQVLDKATQFVPLNDPIANRAQTFVEAGIKPLDALHLASAIEVQADLFCTCDDRFLKKAQVLDTSPTKVVSPLELIAELQT